VTSFSTCTSINFLYSIRTALECDIFGLVIGSVSILDLSGLLRSPIVLILCSISSWWTLTEYFQVDGCSSSVVRTIHSVCAVLCHFHAQIPVMPGHLYLADFNCPCLFFLTALGSVLVARQVQFSHVSTGTRSTTSSMLHFPTLSYPRYAVCRIQVML